MDIFTNVLRKIFVKGSMYLIYERNLILFHNPLFSGSWCALELTRLLID